MSTWSCWTILAQTVDETPMKSGTFEMIRALQYSATCCLSVFGRMVAIWPSSDLWGGREGRDG